MSNGTVTFLPDMETAALQLASDMKAVIAAKTTKPGPEAVPIVLPIIGAIASVVSAAADVASFGLSLASLISSSSSADSDNQTGVGLEIEITNKMSTPLVLMSTDFRQGAPSNGRGGVAKVALSLAPGESEVVLVTNGFFNPNDTTFQLNIAVCFRDSDNEVNFVPVTVNYEWVTHTFTDPNEPAKSVTDKRWQATFEIDDQSSTFKPYLQLFGATFVANEGSGYPNFSVYTLPVATPSGQIDLMFYDYAAQG